MTACLRCDYDPAARVSARWVMGLDMAGLSSNALQSKGTRRWRYIKHRDLALREVTLEMARLHIPPAVAKRRVMFERRWGKGARAFDRDNLVGGFKPVRDALVETGLLVDDTAKWCEAHCSQAGPFHVASIVIELEELA